MTTLIDTIQPPEAYLESVLPEGLRQRSESEYVNQYLTNLIARLKAEPRLYRSFGAWWPSIKSLIIEQDENTFGILVDSDVAAIYTMSRPALTIVAAHLYSNERVESGSVYSAYHSLDVNDDADDTEPYVYVSNDVDMEAFVQIRGKA
ncbi:olxA [Hafnia alvei]|uniref:olxA n=1 Tax=Hafnia alvei TaxID=569 RepID=UPI002DBCB821|nr:olxA [Hafnia alvei]MEB7891829.1 olxA [Hafnia alvei]